MVSAERCNEGCEAVIYYPRVGDDMALSQPSLSILRWTGNTCLLCLNEGHARFYIPASDWLRVQGYNVTYLAYRRPIG